jgi:hypothetical protein
MSWFIGSIPITMYPLMGEEGPPPGLGFLLITDNTNFLMSDGTPLETAGP